MKLLILLTCSMFLFSCSKVPSNSIGIVTEFDGEVRSKPATQGIEITFFDDMDVVDITEIRVPVMDQQPKDSEKVKLEDVDCIITYKVNQDKAIEFYLQTKELDVVDGVKVLGFDIVKTESVTAITNSFLKMPSQEAVIDRDKVNKSIKEELQNKLNERFPKVFEIVNVNTNNVVLDPSIEAIMQKQASVENEKKLLDLKEELVKKQNNNLKMEMEGIRAAASAMGITSDKLLDFKAKMDYNNALRELSKTSTQVQVKAE